MEYVKKALENSKDILAEEALNLYTQFQQFLLEDDID